MNTSTTQAVDTETRSDLALIEENVLTRVHLSDLLRHGAQNTVQAQGWGTGGEACFLSASALAAQDLGYL